MKKVTDTFKFEERLNENYVKELQKTFDKLEHLLLNAYEYSNDKEDKKANCPIWEYVSKEDNNTLIHIVTELMTFYSEEDSETYSAINDFISENIRD